MQLVRHRLDAIIDLSPCIYSAVCTHAIVKHPAAAFASHGVGDGDCVVTTSGRAT